jgi:hypothetical protein
MSDAHKEYERALLERTRLFLDDDAGLGGPGFSVTDVRLEGDHPDTAVVIEYLDARGPGPARRRNARYEVWKGALADEAGLEIGVDHPAMLISVWATGG